VLTRAAWDRPKNKKPTFGLFTEVGCLRFDPLSSYLAITPHPGILL
jgi:hypothetical protein